MSDWQPRGGLRYPDYLRLRELLDLQHPVSRPAHHDETLFLIVHQAFELWFKLALHSLDELVLRLRADDARGALKPLRRASVILRSLTEQVAILETMSTLDFLEFRGGLEGASGFQSAQFRELEALLGLRPEERVPVQLDGGARGAQAYRGPLLEEERERIARRESAPSLEEEFLAMLARRLRPPDPDRFFVSDLPDLLAGESAAARDLLEPLERSARLGDVALRDQLAGRLEALPFWAKLAPPERAGLRVALEEGRVGEALRALGRLEDSSAEWIEVRLVAEEAGRRLAAPLDQLTAALSRAQLPAPRIEAVRSRLIARALLREVYRRAAHQAVDPTVFELWQVAEACLELSQALSGFRMRHVLMVERMIGKRRGTGGSPGAAYLEKTLGYRAFGEILRVRTFL